MEEPSKNTLKTGTIEEDFTQEEESFKNKLCCTIALPQLPQRTGSGKHHWFHISNQQISEEL